ncbi:hypothetical protein RclHR1_30770001 [Rhizophagus clarus]|uniref:Uncharacterized protein n=1 Tax=Rhizophagus clarus TaxID=94130 RepID=A0A2Z6RME2_9GLOM|nr:hypothetical protein RclHR1_30770001 [Rhizophagus clarus]
MGEINQDSGSQSQEDSYGVFAIERVFAFIIAVSLEENDCVSEQDIIIYLDQNFEKNKIRNMIIEGQETYLHIITKDNLLILLYYFIVNS